jgi:hypothetical protein
VVYRLKIGFIVIVGLAIFWQDVGAQVASARLRGSVRDSSGTVIPGAKVVANNTNGRLRAEVLTDERGWFLFPFLPPGEFTISVEAKGFRPGDYMDFNLETNQILDLNLSLQAGDAAAGRKTTSATETIIIPDPQISRTFSQVDLEILPQMTRVPITLGVFQPGVQVQGGDPGTSRINGTRQGSNNLILDSTDVNDPVAPSFGLSLAAVNTESIAQVRVITAGAKAEYGRNSGAQVLLVTRSGGDRWAGSAYDYFQNAVLNANNFFNNAGEGKRPKSNQNVFGFSLGGPLIANRTWIFGNYEGNRFNKEIIRNRTVLTSYAKSGLFTYLPRVANANDDVLTYNIVKNDPRGLGIDPQVAKALSLLPDPNNGDVGDGLNTAGYRFNNPIDGRENQFTIRVDHNLTSNHRIYYRHSWSQDNRVDWLNNADATFPGQPSGRERASQWGFSAGSDWAITTHFVNEFRLGRQSSSSSLLRPARLSTPMMISGLWTDPLNPDFPSARGSRIHEMSDNLTMFREKHAFKAGADVRFILQNRSSTAGTYPDVTFGTSFGNISPVSIGPGSTALTTDERQSFELLYNALLGRIEQVTQTFYSNLNTFQASGSPLVRDYNFREYGIFFQDEWKLRNNLTLSLGVRYELSKAPSESNGLQGVFDPSSSLLDPFTQIDDLTVQRGGAWYKTDANNFAPRFGFAWNPPDIEGLTVRGGFGIFYDRLVGAATNFVDANTPGFVQVGTTFPNQSSDDLRISDGIPFPVQPGAPILMQPITRATSVAIFDPALKNGYISEFHLTLQKKCSANTVFETSYVGTRGLDLFMNQNSNQTKIAGDFLLSFREIQAFRNSLTPVPKTNSLVRLFGSVNGAIKAIGGTTFDQGLVGTAADTVDRVYFSRYSAAGLSDYYLRNFPQFNQLIIGTNQGRSYYDSFQLRVRHRTGAMNVDAAYTWSESRDTISVDAGGFSSPIDNNNVSLNKGRSDADRTHVFSTAITYALPTPTNTWFHNTPGWMPELARGWNIGLLTVWESGLPFTVSSGRQTSAAGVDSWADYSGKRNIGAVIRSSSGAYYFNTDQIQTFTFPAAGEIGTSGRNTFRGPRYFDIDISLAKNIRVNDSQKFSLRVEVYNLFNNTNFGLPATNLSSPSTFGRITSIVGNPRTMQLALRYTF